jgi:hypothetical protein
MRSFRRRIKSRRESCEVCGCHSVREGPCDECKKWQKIFAEVRENQAKARV